MSQALITLLEEGIKPHAEAIAALALVGRIAHVVYDEAAGAASTCEPMRASLRRELCACDHITRRWCERRTRDARVFVQMSKGTLLVNFEPERGWFLEPGSTDSERGMWAS